MREKLKLDPVTYKKVHTSLERIVADLGGHPRALESFYMTLLSYQPIEKFKYSMDDVLSGIKVKTQDQYDLRELKMGTIIAKAFLSQEVFPSETVRDSNGLTFQEFEERGIIKLRSPDHGRRGMSPILRQELLTSTKPRYQVLIPYIFVSTWLTFHGLGEDPAGKFWSQILLSGDFNWQHWEKFNRNYFAFRLSLYSYLKEDPIISLRSFFKGAKCNLDSDVSFKVPPFKSIKLSKVQNRYPGYRNKGAGVKSYDFVMNAAGAPFDAFVFLDTTVPKKRLLVAFQMKFSQTKESEKITAALLESEYKKVQDAVEEYLPGTDFVLVFPIHRKTVKGFSDAHIPKNCILISKEEQKDFYGELYYRRLDMFQSL